MMKEKERRQVTKGDGLLERASHCCRRRSKISKRKESSKIVRFGRGTKEKTNKKDEMRASTSRRKHR